MQGHDVQHVLPDPGEVPPTLGVDHVYQLVPGVGGDDVAAGQVLQRVDEELLGAAVVVVIVVAGALVVAVAYGNGFHVL